MKRRLNLKEKLLLLFQQIRNFILVKRYPFLKPSLGYGCDMEFHRNGYKYHYEETWLDCLPRGWRKAFGIQLCKDLKNVIEKYGIKDYYVSQVKEKFGTLCWYSEGGNEETFKAISKYIDMSEDICQYCGKPAECYTSRWIGFYCKDCAKKYNLEVKDLEKKNETR